jgi:hypothetical protein
MYLQHHHRALGPRVCEYFLDPIRKRAGRRGARWERSHRVLVHFIVPSVDQYVKLIA